MAAAGDDLRHHARVAIGGGEVEALVARPRPTSRRRSRARSCRRRAHPSRRRWRGDCWRCRRPSHAAQRPARSEVSSRYASRAVGDQERVVVRPVLVDVARAALPVRFDQRGDHLDRLRRAARRARGRGARGPCRSAPAPPSASRLKTVWLPMATPCSLRPCSKPQQPERPRADQTRAVSRDLRDLDVLCSAAARPAAWRCRGRCTSGCASAAGPVAVLGEQRRAVGGGAAERHQRIARDAQSHRGPPASPSRTAAVIAGSYPPKK